MLSPKQNRILAALAGASPSSLSGRELRDAVSPGASIKCIHVQVHLMRRKGIPIETSVGRAGGFRITRASCGLHLKSVLNVLPLPEVQRLTGRSYATLAMLAQEMAA